MKFNSIIILRDESQKNHHGVHPTQMQSANKKTITQ